MSHDVYLEIDTGSDTLATVVEVGNYTSNVAGMWRKALGGESLSDFDGRNAGESVEVLAAAVAWMEADPDAYRAMDPDNGWGRYEGASDYLTALLGACREHPKCQIRVS